MASWDSTPDPYTYRRARRLGLGGRPVYVVSLDGREIGVIVPRTINTDRKVGRLRIQGRGRDGFAAVVPRRHSFTGDLLGSTRMLGKGIERDRRRDAADDLVQRAERDEAMTPEFIARSVAFYDQEPA